MRARSVIKAKHWHANWEFRICISSFNGYWPERGGAITTCSFKELEAIPTVIRVQEQNGATLVIASAGNTARAFLQVSALTGSRWWSWS